jgi:hypothetical protein
MRTLVPEHWQQPILVLHTHKSQEQVAELVSEDRKRRVTGREPGWDLAVRIARILIQCAHVHDRLKSFVRARLLADVRGRVPIPASIVPDRHLVGNRGIACSYSGRVVNDQQVVRIIVIAIEFLRRGKDVDGPRRGEPLDDARRELARRAAVKLTRDGSPFNAPGVMPTTASSICVAPYATSIGAVGV